MSNLIKTIIKHILVWGNYFIGIILSRKPCRLIIYYHGVLDSETKYFEQQIQYLKKECQIVPLSEIAVTKHSSGKNIIAITFDDAFENLLTNALPLLTDNKVPATIFAPVGNLGTYPKWYIPEGNPDINQKVMTEEDLQQIDRNGFEVGSHTTSHAKLTTLNQCELQIEIEESKSRLEQILKHTVETLSYPNGCYNQAVLDKVKKCGYRNAYTIAPSCIQSENVPLEIPRFKVTPGMAYWMFKLVISGAYSVIGSIKQK